ncbi:MAG: hypothetical protein ACTS2F_29760 [Thainema sp.]
MQQRRLKAYLELIQELLSCPSGEEWIRLRQHEDLVDAGFVQTMEQVATSLAQEGDMQRATFLHNWAGQLHHILTQTTAPPREEKSKAYLDFIQLLLGASPKEQQQLIAANQDLIGPGLFNMMRQIGAQLAAQGNRDAGIYLTNLSEEMRKLWLQQHGFQSPPLSAEVTEPRAKGEPASYKQSKPSSTRQPTSKAPTTPQDAQKSPTAAQSAPPVVDPTIPDPWAESDSSSEGTPSETAASAAVAAPATLANSTAVSSTPELAERVLQELNQHLAAIATALTELTERLATHPPSPPPPPRPLWHLEALEQACQAGWVLTTEEVEQLIQVKPKCSAKEDHFDRGNWRFIKVGKIGIQVAWRIEKLELEQT